MEKYIHKIEERLDKKHSPAKAAKIKKRFLVVGGIVLAIGLAGILIAMICFSMYFVGGDTDTALTCWIIAVPFVIVFIAGAVVARVGDKMKNNALAKTKVAQDEAVVKEVVQSEQKKETKKTEE